MAMAIFHLAKLMHVKVPTEVGYCWNTFQCILQQTLVLEWGFKFLNALPMPNQSPCSFQKCLHLKNWFYRFYLLQHARGQGISEEDGHQRNCDNVLMSIMMALSCKVSIYSNNTIVMQVKNCTPMWMNMPSFTLRKCDLLYEWPRSSSEFEQ